MCRLPASPIAKVAGNRSISPDHHRALMSLALDVNEFAAIRDASASRTI